MIPRPRQTVIERPRLTEALMSGSQKVLLAAPSGWGKTTLLIQIGNGLSKQGLDVVWVDAADLHHQMAREGDVLLVDGIDSGNFTRTHRYLEQWSEARKGRRVVAAANAPQFDIPLGWKVVTEDDLRFTAEEVRALAGALSVASPAAGAPWPGLPETEGWPLAVRARLMGEDHMHFATGLYLTIPSGPLRIKAGLLAHTERLRPSLLPLSLGISQTLATERLNTLVGLGVASVKTDEDGPCYYLRPWLKPYFRTLGGVTEAKHKDVERMHALFEEGRYPLSSLGTLLDVRDMAGAETLVGRNFEHLVGEGPRTLAALRRVSFQELEQYPSLSMLRLVLERAQEEIPIEAVERVARDLRARLLRVHPDPTNDPFILVTLIAVERMLGMWDSALALSHRAMELFDAPYWRTNVGQGRLPSSLYAVISLTGILGADYVLANDAAERGFRLASERDNRLEKAQALALSALSSALLGNVVEAARYLERFDRLGGYADLNPPAFIWVNDVLARALLAFHEGERREGEEILSQVVPLMHRMEQWPIVAVVEAAFVRLIRGPHAAYRLLKQRLEQQPGSREIPPAWRAQLWTQLAMQAVMLGRYEEAQEILDGLEKDLKLPPGQGGTHVLAQVQLDLYRGEYQQVIDRLAALKDWGDRPRRLTEFRLFEALAHYGLGDGGMVAAALREVQDRQDRFSILTRYPYELLSEAIALVGMEGLAEDLEQMPEHLRSYQEEVLSAAELRVLDALGQGMTAAEAAEFLYISENTVKTHRRSIYKKLSAAHWDEAAFAARRRGLL